MTEAERITRALGGDWRGGHGLAPCPVCQPEGRKDQRALSLSDKAGRLLVHCHKGGCAVLDELRKRGLADHRGGRLSVPDPDAGARQSEEDRKKEARRLEAAHRLFADAVSCEGTPAQRYLEGARGLSGLHFNRMRNTLRFHPSAHHSPTGQDLPAMIAQIRGPRGEALGVHRTYLKADGSGKAEVPSPKMMLGPSSGGAVRFGSDERVIALAEGIETGLSIAKASRLTTWCTLSTSGLKGLILPPLPVAEIVIVAADHDDAGLSAAAAAKGRMEAEGRTVAVIHPPAPGADFNDVLRGEV